jgi:16S rRNA (uracil1498-N3)-methyltransferase
MPHLHRFYITPDTATTSTILLPPEEAHHALKVVRVRVGDAVVLFDGKGREISGQVDAAERRHVEIRVEEERAVPTESPRLTMAVGGLHKEKSVEFILRHGTEVGVSHFIFFRAAHSERAPRRHDKWDRIAIEVCKQNGRSWLPTFEIMDDLQAVLNGASGTVLIAAMDEEPLPLASALGNENVMLLVGPEGDFTAEEMTLARQSGAHPVSFGAYTLRSEVAATLGATLIQHHLGKLGPR